MSEHGGARQEVLSLSSLIESLDNGSSLEKAPSIHPANKGPWQCCKDYCKSWSEEHGVEHVNAKEAKSCTAQSLSSTTSAGTYFVSCGHLKCDDKCTWYLRKYHTLDAWGFRSARPI